jgi:uncharacterized membrane protein
LEVHEDSGNLSSLQGGVPRQSRPELMQRNWTPALRMAAGALGSTLIVRGMRTPGIKSTAGSMAGAALLGRAICNRGFREMTGLTKGARVIEIEKVMNIHAPVEDVFTFWSHYHAFPRVMTHLKEVRDLGNGKSHWVAQGLAGIPAWWDAELTKSVANKLLEWRSVPGSPVETEGAVRFDTNADATTRVAIRMFYRPPGGVMGHCILSLLGADLKTRLDDDMVRLKSLIELGRTRAHGMVVTREGLEQAPNPA